MTMLTDEEIEKCREKAAASYKHHRSSIRGQQVTEADDPEMHLIWAVIAAYEAKLREQEPVGYFCPEYMGGPVIYYQVQYSSKDDEGVVPLFEHPAPIPEGYALVPIDPEGQCSNDDLINIMVDAYQDRNGGYYDSMLAAYKALLAIEQ